MNCLKKFDSPFELNRHERTHTDEKAYSCKEDEGYNICHADTNVEVEMRDERPFHCAKCGKNFVLESVLKKHERICKEINSKAHETAIKENRIEVERDAEKPYKCTRCDEKFLAIRSLRKHERSHRNRQNAAVSWG